MSMKQEIETWVAALRLLDSGEFQKAIDAFQPIADTSKILFNCGMIHATLGDHEIAVEYYRRATSLDQYLAIAYFQQGVSEFLQGHFEEAYTNFNYTLLYLRGNKFIDYEQLGLNYKLYSCAALFNRGLCYIYLQQIPAGMSDLNYAAKEKATPEHDVIDEAIEDCGEGYTVFSVAGGIVFRPSDAKVKNVRTRDYLGKARLVATTSDQNTHRRQLSADQWARDDRLPENISYAATHLVRPPMAGRSRQQSEPPLHRNVFPPTPPPESEKPATLRTSGRNSPDNAVPGARSTSLSRASKPEKLNLGIAAFDNRPTQQQSTSAQRRAPARSASERPPERRYDRRASDASTRNSPPREKLFGMMAHEGEQEAVGEQLARSRPPVAKSNTLPRQQHQTTAQAIEEEDEEQHYYNPDVARASASTLPSIRSDSDRYSAYRRSGYHSGAQRGGALGLSKIRVKVHYGDDTRFVFITLRTALAELNDQLSKKFAIAVPFKTKIRDDEGDMITMGDQDDLEMAVSMCKEAAAREGSDVGKIEMWVQAV